MTRFLSFLYRLIVKLWPIWFLFFAQFLGGWLWQVATAGMTSPTGLAVAARGLVAAQTLGPVIPLIAAVIAYRSGLVALVTVRAASAALFVSMLISLWQEYSRLSPYLSYFSFGELLTYADPWLVVALVLGGVAIAGSLWAARADFSAVAADVIKRARGGLHGDADWMPLKEAKQRFNNGGIIIGEAVRTDLSKVKKLSFDPKNKGTWGEGGKAPLLRFDGETDSGHVIVFAGSGGYKTTGVVVPTALEWPSSLVVIDPKGEVADLVGQVRRQTGRKVVVLQPGKRDSASLNVLDWIDTDSENALTQLPRVVSWLLGEQPIGKNTNSGDGSYWLDSTRALVGVILADLLFDNDVPPEQKTLTTLRMLLAQPMSQLTEHLGVIYEKGPDYGFGFPAELAGMLKDIPDKQFAGFYGMATTATSWLRIPSLAALVSGTTANRFSARDILGGKLDVFICLDKETLKENPAIARLIIGSLLNACYLAGGKISDRVLFLLDEAATLGYMSLLEQARDVGRGYKITLLPIFQTIGQLEAFGPAGTKSWFDSTYLKIFSNIGDFDTAEIISKACGEFTAVAKSTNEGEGGAKRFGEVIGTRNSQYGSQESESARRLIKPDEILQKLRADEAIILIKGAQPLRCGRAIWFRRPEMSARLAGLSVPKE